jgi:hypothetical protein
MHLDQIARRFDSLAHQGLIYRLAPGAALSALQEAEVRLNVKFPGQVTAFWSAFDGIEVDDPPFKLLPVREMKRGGDLIVFGVCDRTVRIAFDVSGPNHAGQWSILNAETGYCITFTMASLWSVHMWSWIVKHRPFWYDAHKPGDLPQVMLIAIITKPLTYGSQFLQESWSVIGAERITTIPRAKIPAVRKAARVRGRENLRNRDQKNRVPD